MSNLQEQAENQLVETILNLPPVLQERVMGKMWKAERRRTLKNVENRLAHELPKMVMDCLIDEEKGGVDDIPRRTGFVYSLASRIAEQVADKYPIRPVCPHVDDNDDTEESDVCYFDDPDTLSFDE